MMDTLTPAALDAAAKALTRAEQRVDALVPNAEKAFAEYAERQSLAEAVRWEGHRVRAYQAAFHYLRDLKGGIAQVRSGDVEVVDAARYVRQDAEQKRRRVYDLAGTLNPDDANTCAAYKIAVKILEDLADDLDRVIAS